MKISNIIICKHCKATFFDDRLYEEHLKSLHNKIPIYRCKKCPDEKFKGVDEFDKHLKDKHGVPIWDTRLKIKEISKIFEHDPYFQKLNRQKLCGICGSQSTTNYKIQKGDKDTTKFVLGGSCEKHNDEVKQMLEKELDSLYG